MTVDPNRHDECTTVHWMHSSTDGHQSVIPSAAAPRRWISITHCLHHAPLIRHVPPISLALLWRFLSYVDSSRINHCLPSGVSLILHSWCFCHGSSSQRNPCCICVTQKNSAPSVSLAILWRFLSLVLLATSSPEISLTSCRSPTHGHLILAEKDLVRGVMQLPAGFLLLGSRFQHQCMFYRNSELACVIAASSLQRQKNSSSPSYALVCGVDMSKVEHGCNVEMDELCVVSTNAKTVIKSLLNATLKWGLYIDLQLGIIQEIHGKRWTFLECRQFIQRFWFFARCAHAKPSTLEYQILFSYLRSSRRMSMA